MADIAAVIIIACTAIQARIRLTLIDVYVTIDALIAGTVTSACIIIEPIDADAAVLAWIRNAFVDINFAVLSSPTSLTLALVLAVR